MPHAFLTTRKTLMEIAEGWQEQSLPLGDIRVKVRRGYLQVDGKSALFPALVLEPFQQRWFYIELRRKADSRFLIRLDPITPVPRSPGVRLALAWFTRQLSLQFPGSHYHTANLGDFFELLDKPQEEQPAFWTQLQSKLRRQLRAAERRSQAYRYSISLENETPPISWEEVFGDPYPVEIEIGPGKGKFILEQARKNPEKNFLAIEWAGRYLKILAERIPRAQLKNVRLLQADARTIFREWIKPNSVAVVHIYYPDPWWKKRHEKHKLFSAEFLRNLHKALVPGGMFQFATDVEDVYLQLRTLVEECGGFQQAHEKRYLPGGEPPPGRSNFEVKKWRSGSTIYETFWRKT